MVTALDVSKLFLLFANKNGDLITNLKMQKLLYYAQAWYLVNYNRRLFGDNIEAWEFGPVIPSIYRKYSKYKASPIPYQIGGSIESKFKKHQINFLNEFFKVFSSLSATALVSMAHNEAPWKNAYVKGQNNIIDVREMKEFYRRQLEDKYSG